MRLLFIIVPLMLWFSSLSAQESLYRQPLQSESDRQIFKLMKQRLSDPYSDTWNLGSAKKLEGAIYVLEVWATSPGTRWNYAEMVLLQERIDQAVNWISRLAASYGKPITIKSGSFAGNNYEGIPLDGLPTSYAEASTFQQLMPQLLKKVGYSSVMHCYNSLSRSHCVNNVVTLILINNEGWPCTNNFSVGHFSNGFLNYFMENTYIFRTYQGKPVPAQTIAHEILHQFGAWDMYEGQAKEEAARWARANYPNEIMLQVRSPLSELSVSPLTAWLLGLSDRYYPWYWNFARIPDSHVDE